MSPRRRRPTIDWDRPPWYEHAPKRPPPEHGIKIKKTGTTWWGQRWIEALDRMSANYSNRLARGRTYARAGRTHDLVVVPGRVSAKVTGSRPTPYDVTLTLTRFSDAQWEKAIVTMAERAQFSAELLTGEMPKNIDDAFREAGTSLFPAKESDLVTECSCPDWANPCKHVAATHYVFGEALDRDPFLLFELRGRTKRAVLDALRAARAGLEPGERTDVSQGEPRGERTAATTLANLEPADYDKPREPLPALHLSFEEPVVHGAVLQQLGKPEVWAGDASPADLLTPLLRATAERARQMALAEPSTPPTAPAVDPRKPPRKRAVKHPPKKSSGGARPRRR